MSHIYNVYEHPQKGQWGFTPIASDGEVKTALIRQDGRLTRASIQPIKLGPLMQQHMRGGFRKLTHAKYLNVTEGGARGEFVSQHPDLNSPTAGQLLFFVAVPQGADMQQLASAWRDRLLDARAGNRTWDQWLDRCALVTTYVPVMEGDPHIALLVGQWARENNLVLVNKVSEVPPRGPQESRYAWRDYLSSTVPVKDVDRALAELGWPLNEAVTTPVVAATEAKPLDGDDAWIALSQQASF